jgi:hypothetical protein
MQPALMNFCQELAEINKYDCGTNDASRKKYHTQQFHRIVLVRELSSTIAKTLHGMTAGLPPTKNIRVEITERVVEDVGAVIRVA